jgi:hypothetical protein
MREKASREQEARNEARGQQKGGSFRNQEMWDGKISNNKEEDYCHGEASRLIVLHHVAMK